jgi:hypothetical protein
MIEAPRIVPPAGLPPHVRLMLNAWWDDRQGELQDGFFVGFPAARAWYDAMVAYLEEGPVPAEIRPVSFPSLGSAQRYWFDVHHRAPRPSHGAHVRIIQRAPANCQGIRETRYFVAQYVGGRHLLLTLGEGAKLSWQPEHLEVSHG